MRAGGSFNGNVIDLSVLLRILCPIAITASLCACYPRVKLTDEEQQRIPIHGRRQMVVMTSNNGLTDTLIFERSERTYEAHFDVWWERNIRRDPPRADKRRGHYLTYLLRPLPTGTAHLNLWSFPISFVKHGDSEQLVLSIADFTEEYVLDASTPDTLVFQTLGRQPAASCDLCVTWVTWSPTEGLLAIGSLDGTAWRRMGTPMHLSR